MPENDPDMSKSALRARGAALRRELMGAEFTDKLDQQQYTNRHMERFAEMAQELVFGQIWTRGVIDLKLRSLITVISDVATGAIGALKLHVRFCRNQGWSEDEIVESILHCLGYVGMPLVRDAVIAATEAFAQMRAEGVVKD